MIGPVLGHGRVGVCETAFGTAPFTQSDARHLSNLLPFRQVLGIKNVVNVMVGRFEEE